MNILGKQHDQGRNGVFTPMCGTARRDDPSLATAWYRVPTVPAPRLS